MKSIKLDGVTFGYVPGKPLFTDVSVEIKSFSGSRGHIVGLMGNSGAGKTTFLKLVMGALLPDKGRIITSHKDPVWAYVPQHPVLFEHLSILDNARYFMTTKHYRKRYNPRLFKELADELSLTDVLSSSGSVAELSGGQRQRLSLLRALSISPDFLLMDEPTTGLDANVKIQLLNKVREISDHSGLLVLYVTHHRQETELIMDEVIYLHSSVGQPVNEVLRGTIAEFISTSPVAEAAKVFSYPTPNEVRVRLTDGGFTFPATQEEYDESMYKALLSNDDLTFAETGDVAVNLLSRSDVYAIVQVGDVPNIINVPRAQVSEQRNRLVLSRPIRVYDRHGAFVGKLKLTL